MFLRGLALFPANASLLEERRTVSILDDRAEWPKREPLLLHSSMLLGKGTLQVTQCGSDVASNDGEALPVNGRVEIALKLKDGVGGGRGMDS